MCPAEVQSFGRGDGTPVRQRRDAGGGGGGGEGEKLEQQKSAPSQTPRRAGGGGRTARKGRKRKTVVRTEPARPTSGSEDSAAWAVGSMNEDLAGIPSRPTPAEPRERERERERDQPSALAVLRRVSMIGRDAELGLNGLKHGRSASSPSPSPSRSTGLDWLRTGEEEADQVERGGVEAVGRDGGPSQQDLCVCGQNTCQNTCQNRSHRRKERGERQAARYQSERQAANKIPIGKENRMRRRAGK
eukprot:SAG22_NODE_467_length_10171_cov_4.306295_5_plen_245_part_00